LVSTTNREKGNKKNSSTEGKPTNTWTTFFKDNWALRAYNRSLTGGGKFQSKEGPEQVIQKPYGWFDHFVP